jgi:hypothetical protein
MRSLLTFLLAILILTIASLLPAGAGNFAPGFHEVHGHWQAIYVEEFGQDACELVGDGSTIAILDSVHYCSDPQECPACLVDGEGNTPSPIDKSPFDH